MTEEKMFRKCNGTFAHKCETWLSKNDELIKLLYVQREVAKCPGILLRLEPLFCAPMML